MTESNGRLDSWKEIARHLGRDVRTVMRWEAARGLPVHRLPGTKRSVVFAYRDEVDAWLAQHLAPPAETSVASSDTLGPVPDPGERATSVEPPTGDRGWTRRRPLWIGAAALAFTALVLAATLASNAARRPVADLAIDGTELRARDAEGRVLWVHRFDAAGIAVPSGRWTHIGDLDADGQPEIVAVVKTQRTPTSEVVDEMLCFSEDGRLRWRRVPDTRLRFGDGEYEPPWASEDLLAFESNGEPRLAWAVRHYTWWPSMLLVLDATGAERGRFVNSGWIRSVGISHDGGVLMASGVSNAHRATFFALLDAARVMGSSPEMPGSDYACLECDAGRPLQYFVLPRTDVSEHATFPPLHAPAIQTFSDGAAQVRVSENGEPNPPETIYELSPTYALQRARFSDSFWEWHRRLEADGLLQHDEQTCPMRGFLDVRHWASATGWSTMHVPSR